MGMVVENYSSLAKPTVLIVEDEAPLLTLLRYNLEKQGFRVDEAADGQDREPEAAHGQHPSGRSDQAWAQSDKAIQHRGGSQRWRKGGFSYWSWVNLPACGHRGGVEPEVGGVRSQLPEGIHPWRKLAVVFTFKRIKDRGANL